MTAPGHILIVDDDAPFVRIYREIFENEGLLVTAAHTPAEATSALGSTGPQFDVVLLDQKLQGPGGPDTGLDLIEQVARLAPFAKIIVVTGYATPTAIERAFELGVYDYLVKNGAFEALLRAKVRNAIEVTSAQRQVALNEAEVIGELRALWTKVRSEPERNRNRKGKLLEEVIKLLFRATPGFGRVNTRLDNGIQEIDIAIDNRANELPWRDEGAYLLGECKNWSSRCGSKEVRNFRDKLTTKYSRVRTGFLFAPGGLTKEAHEEARSHKAGTVLVILVDGDDLEQWIAADDRRAILDELHSRATLDVNR